MPRTSDLNSDELIALLARRYIRKFQSEGNVQGSQIGRVFENNFYEAIGKNPRFHVISTSGDLGMGFELATTSGIRHEIDCVLSDDETLYVFELKHYFENDVTKDMLVIFNQKVLDFYFELIRSGRFCKIKRIFVTRSERLVNFTREFAMSWGIGLIDNEAPHSLQKFALRLFFAPQSTQIFFLQPRFNTRKRLAKTLKNPRS